MPTDPDPQIAQRLPLARVALERGDYGQVVRLLTQDDGTSPASKDAELLLLLATAWMGLGRNEEALICCRRLRASSDSSLRTQARELQRVLEAPALARPREWSLTLPDLGSSEAAMGRQLSSIKRTRRPKPPPPPPPAVGPTKAPVGFAVIVTLLVLLGLLLGGCGTLRSELAFSGAGRLQLRHHLLQQSTQPPPLQQELIRRLRQQGFQARSQGRELVLSTGVLPTRLVLDQLDRSIAAATELAGLSANPCQLSLQSRNWLVAVDEQLLLAFDLQDLGPWSPDLSLALTGLPARAVRNASPAPVGPGPDGALLWPLQDGALNTLELRLWRWSPLGLGGVAVLATLLLSLALQHLRRVLGFGLPALPR